MMSKSIVLVTGAGTGIGHLSVKALGLAGHTVCASIPALQQGGVAAVAPAAAGTGIVGQ
jgi:NAD(P)-dependent dehydrogenase (short-subunit alcohol dehydrogenase family)